MKKSVFLTISVLMLVVFTGIPIIKASDNYLGSENCKVCHPAEYEAWKSGPHADALYALEAEKRNDSKCLSCHTPNKNSATLGVGCESCHGAGAHYAKDFIMRDKPLAKALGLKIADYDSCLVCHRENAPTIKDFDPKKAWHKLPHSNNKK